MHLGQRGDVAVVEVKAGAVGIAGGSGVVKDGFRVDRVIALVVEGDDLRLESGGGEGRSHRGTDEGGFLRCGDDHARRVVRVLGLILRRHRAVVDAARLHAFGIKDEVLRVGLVVLGLSSPPLKLQRSAVGPRERSVCCWVRPGMTAGSSWAALQAGTRCAGSWESAAPKFDEVAAHYQVLYPEMGEVLRSIRSVTQRSIGFRRCLWRRRIPRREAWPGFTDWILRHGRFAGLAFHSYDLRFVWDVFGSEAPSAAARALSAELHAAWLAFIRGEVPQAAGLPPWPKYRLDERQTVILIETSRIELDPSGAERMLWNGMLMN